MVNRAAKGGSPSACTKSTHASSKDRLGTGLLTGGRDKPRRTCPLQSLLRLLPDPWLSLSLPNMASPLLTPLPFVFEAWSHKAQANLKLPELILLPPPPAPHVLGSQTCAIQDCLPAHIAAIFRSLSGPACQGSSQRGLQTVKFPLSKEGEMRIMGPSPEYPDTPPSQMYASLP